MQDFFRRRVKDLRFEDLLLALSIGFLVVASVFIGKKEAAFNSLNGDVLVFNSLFHDPFKWGDMYILSEHSFVIKYPLFALENLIGFNLTIHTVFSILTILGMNLGVAWLVYKFSNKNKVVTSLLLFALTSITLFSITQNYFWGYSALAIRNIEIPLTVFAIIGLFRQKKLLAIPTIGYISLLTLLYLSDKMVLAFLLGATVLYFAIEIMRTGKLSKLRSVFRQDLVFYVAVISSIVSAVAIEVAIRVTKIVLLTATTPMRTINDVPTLFDAFTKFVSGTINLFGANFFDKTILQALPNLVNILILVFMLWVVCRLAKRYVDIKEKAVRFLLLMLVANLAVFFLLHQTATDRYLAFAPFLIVLLVAYVYRDARIGLPRTPPRQVMLIGLAILVLAVFGYYSRQQHSVMTAENYNSIATPLTQTRDISDDLRDNRIGILVGNYWLIHPARFWYDEKFDSNLVITPAVPLSEDKVGFGRFISRESWLTTRATTGPNSAYAIRDFDYGPGVDIDKAAKETFGDYTKKIYYQDGGIHIYIYNYDIRERLTLPAS